MNKRTQIIISLVIIIILLAGVAIFVYLSKNIPSVEIPVEIQKPVEKVIKDCLVLDEEHCKKGEPLYDKDGKLVGLGFNLPVGTKIYAPFDGAMTYPFGSSVFPNALYLGFEIEKRENNFIYVFLVVGNVKPTIKSKEFLYPEEPDKLANEPVQKGEVVAERVEGRKEYDIEVGGIITLDGEKVYDILIDFQKYDISNNSGIRDLDSFKQFFGLTNLEK